MSSEQRKTNTVQVKQQGGAVATVDLEKFADTGLIMWILRVLHYHS